ncbi:ester cyclase [soil metagenome]
MTAEQNNIAFVKRWFEEVWNDRRADLIDEMVTCESVCHMDEDAIQGPDEFKVRQYVPFITAFPDLRIEIEAAIAQGDHVVIRWCARGTHTGEGLGFAPTQRPACFRGISWVQVGDGKFLEGWQNSNISEILRNLSEATPERPDVRA